MANRFDDPRAATKVRPGYWFVPKRVGLGATPVTWQGWALTMGYAAALFAIVRLVPGLAVRIVLGTVLTLMFLYLARLKTDGGWHWHWGARRGDRR